MLPAFLAPDSIEGFPLSIPLSDLIVKFILLHLKF